MLISLAAVVFRPEPLSLSGSILSLAIVWAGLLPGIAYWLRSDPQRPTIPLMALTGLFYAVFFGLPGFFVHLLDREGDGRLFFYENTAIDGVSISSQWAVLIAIIIMFASWSFAKTRLLVFLPAIRLHEPRQGDNNTTTLVLAWGLVFGSLTYHLIPVRSSPTLAG